MCELYIYQTAGTINKMFSSSRFCHFHLQLSLFNICLSSHQPIANGRNSPGNPSIGSLYTLFGKVIYQYKKINCIKSSDVPHLELQPIHYSCYIEPCSCRDHSSPFSSTNVEEVTVRSDAKTQHSPSSIQTRVFYLHVRNVHLILDRGCPMETDIVER